MGSSAYGYRPSIEDVKAIQRIARALNYHIVWFDEEGFIMAHTDKERASVSSYPLTACELHLSLSEADEMPVPEPGYYMYLPAFGKFERLPIN